MTAQDTKTVDMSEVIRKVEADRREFEARTVGARVTEWNGDHLNPAVVTRDVMIKELREVFDLYRGTAAWKDPVAAKVPANKAMVFIEAVKFYHGGPAPDVATCPGEPGYIVVMNDGYAF